MSNTACPFCGDPHPILTRTAEEMEAAYQDADYPWPECEHYLGRYDTDGTHYIPYWMDRDEDEGGFTGPLGLLNEIDLSPCVDEDDKAEEWPTAALKDAFGDRTELARAVYRNEWDRPGEPGEILTALIDDFGIKTIEVLGGTGPMDSWISYDYYAQDPKAVLERLRQDAKALEAGVRAIRS